ncbi:hypothetical protein [Acidithiobacillus thiooxidans]|uniref:Uncharacterized protein n=1 Tax=Acidithiobacillus thiooxidans TaxID=930 RepID=A0A1C2IGL1_ACITH|nr:hypothetical protein [Acidithiobacillus thiooxidans]OCX75121.1 hypothetical protein A6M23_03440 [Acidithiobacillus thiooxidans]OCX81709.1 hypothetical protein A6P08_13325 [Acidithiobacillus thiooxidans]
MPKTIQESSLSRRSFLMKTATLVGATVAANTISISQAAAQEGPELLNSRMTPVVSGITYQHIGRWEVSRLNHILSVEAPAFTGFKVDYKPALNAVDLFRVTALRQIEWVGGRMLWSGRALNRS